MLPCIQLSEDVVESDTTDKRVVVNDGVEVETRHKSPTEESVGWGLRTRGVWDEGKSLEEGQPVSKGSEMSFP